MILQVSAGRACVAEAYYDKDKLYCYLQSRIFDVVVVVVVINSTQPPSPELSGT